MTTLRGEIFAFFEQGMEGRIEFAFAPDGSSDFVFLARGQRLTIFDERGQVLWAGEIQFVRVGWRDKSALTVWSDVKQKGVTYDTWMRYFWRELALRATLEFAD